MSKERILITGANGNLGGALVKELADNTPYEVIAVSSDQAKIYDMLERECVIHRERVTSMNSDTFFHTNWSDLGVFACVHMAFSRANQSKERIAASLDFSKNVYRRLHEMSVPRIVYLSSQSVYGAISEWRSEDCAAAPESVYSMAKYAGEKLLEAEFTGSQTEFSILRLDYVIQSQNLVPVLCRSAKETGTIRLQGGKQTFSYIDKSDVAKAIIALLDYNGPWQRVYNVGHDHMRYSLQEVADIVAKVAEKDGKNKISISLEENDTILWAGMDSARFMSDTGWHPLMDLYQMVEEIYKKN
ncbi:MAG: NAD(P)-dependent oxidoreductase [Eubacteriales bacterium]|nr:NAD(P)-dependent oxidoreductase [Eubacteriales bacterium]